MANTGVTGISQKCKIQLFLLKCLQDFSPIHLEFLYLVNLRKVYLLYLLKSNGIFLYLLNLL
nr:MAG TPA: hypothetical protein [Caudoviricetes sp.]